MEENEIKRAPINAIIPGPIANNSKPIKAKPRPKNIYVNKGFDMEI